MQYIFIIFSVMWLFELCNKCYTYSHVLYSCTNKNKTIKKTYAFYLFFFTNFMISASNLAKTRFFVCFISNICVKIVLCFWPTFHP